MFFASNIGREWRDWIISLPPMHGRVSIKLLVLFNFFFLLTFCLYNGFNFSSTCAFCVVFMYKSM